MVCVASRVSKAEASAIMEKLARADIQSSLQYHPMRRSGPADQYSVLVSDEDLEGAFKTLGVEADKTAPEEDPDDDAEPDSTLLSCPQCGAKQVSVAEKDGCAAMALAPLTLGVSLVLMTVHVRRHGSKKKCRKCLHEWRSKP